MMEFWHLATVALAHDEGFDESPGQFQRICKAGAIAMLVVYYS